MDGVILCEFILCVYNCMVCCLFKLMYIGMKRNGWVSVFESLIFEMLFCWLRKCF